MHSYHIYIVSFQVVIPVVIVAIHQLSHPASQKTLLKESKEVLVASVQRIFKVVSQRQKHKKNNREKGYRYKNRQKQRQ